MPDGQNRNREPQFFSRIRFYESESNLSMGFKYWKGMLAISIDQWVKDGDKGEYKNLQEAYFSPVKAHMLAVDLENFVKDSKHNPVGVDLGRNDVKTCVTFAHGKEADEMYICDLNPDGTREKEVTFHFATAGNYTIEYANYQKMEWSKNNHQNVEVVVIKKMLKEFADAMLGGAAYGVMDFQRFHDARVDNNMNRIMEKLGIQIGNGNNRGGYNSNRGGGNNVFAGNGNAPQNTGSTHREIDDLDDMLDD